MNYELKTKDRKLYVLELSEGEYESLKKELLNSKSKFIEIHDSIILKSEVTGIEKMQERPKIVAPAYRLESPESHEVKVRRPGGLQAPSTRKHMERLFRQFKQNGAFKNFATYEQWEHIKYCSQESNADICEFCKKVN